MSQVDHEQNSQSQDWQKADARVLGQILAAQNVVFALPDATRIAEFYAQALISLPGITACRVCLGGQSVQAGEMASSRCAECETLRRLTGEDDTLIPASSDFRCTLADRPDTRVIPIDSYQHHFGFFVTQIENAVVFEAYYPFISNLSNYVALILENRQQKALLQKAHDELEDRVEERTRELTVANAALDASRLTALNITQEAIEARQRAEQANFDLQREVAERKRAEQNIALMNFALNNVHEAAFLIDEQARFHFVNEESCRILGYSRAELLGLSVPDVDPDFPVDRWRNHWSNLKAQRSLTFEGRHRAKDGRIFPVEVNANYFEYGSRAYNLALVRDITERKRAEEALRESEQKFRSFVEESSEGFTLVDEQGAIIEWNHAREKMTGLPASQVIGQKIWDVLHQMLPPALQTPERYERNKQPILNALQTGKSPLFDNVLEAEVVRQNGERQFIQQTIFPIKTDQGYRMGSVTRDITERERAEEALRQSEERFRRLAENARDVIYRMSIPDGIYEYVSPAALSVFGYSPEECYKTPMLIKQAIHPDWQMYFEKQWANLIKGDIPPTYEYQFIHKSGKVRWLNQRNILVRDNAGNPIAIEGIVTDITERKRAEEALRRSAEEIYDLYNHAPCGYHSLNNEGVFIQINDTELQWLGYSRDEVIGKMKFAAFITGKGLQTFEENFLLFKERGWVKDLEFEMLRKDGTFLSVLVSSTAIYDDDGNYVMSRSTVYDISERKWVEVKLQERERHSQSLLRLSRRLESAQTYDEVLNAAQDEVTNIIGYQNLWAYLFDPDKKEARSLFVKGPMADLVMTDAGVATLTIEGDRMLEEIVAPRDIVVVEDAQIDERTNKDLVGRLGNRTIVNIPIILFDRHLGSVGTGTFDDEGVRVPGESEKEYLRALASHLAVTLDRIHLLEQRKQAEETLTHERNLLRTLIDHIPDFIYIKDVESRFLIANASVAHHMGAASPTELVGRTDWDFYPPERVAQFYADEQAIMQSGKPLLDHDEPNVDASGNLRWIMTTKLPVRDSRGQIIGLVGIGHDLTERKQAEQERQAHLRFLASMDQINRAMQGTNELEQMMRDVLDVVLSIFDCDRAWLLYPLEPGVPTWQAPIERTRLDGPGALASGAEIPVDPDLIRLLRTAQDSSVVVQSSPGTEYQVPVEIAKQLNIQSQLAMAVYPKVDKPYLFGLHQCSFPRIWTSQEERLFQEIGRRLGDALTSLLIFRNLQESEAKFSTAFRSSPAALSVSTAKDHVYIDANDSFLEWTGYTRAEVIGRTSIELHLWAVPDQDREFRRRLHEHGNVHNFEYAYRRKDGAVRYALVSATFIMISGEPCVLAQSNDITERRQAEKSLWESSHMLKLVLDNMPAFVFWKDRNSVYLGCNYLFAANAGLSSPQDIIGLTDLDLPWKNAEAESYRADDRSVMDTGKPKLNYEETQLTADGRVTDVRTSKIPLRNPEGDVIGVLGTFEDITERKRAEARILRLNRLYATLSQINQTIVHVRDREKLFHEICRVAVEHGKFRLAWISLIDEATYRVEPVAYTGEEQGYLAAITITYRDEPLGRGPTGTAIREGRCVLCQDIATDASMTPWRDQALLRGYRASAAVPFRQHGRVIGTLTVFAAEPLGFDDEDEQLLDEIGQDISFALDALEQEAQRRQAEAELNELNAELEQRVLIRTAELARAHEHLRAILDTAGEGVVFTDPQGIIEYINPAMERLTGYQATEVIGRNPRVWKSDQTPAATYRHMWSALTGGEIWQGELINRRKDGTLFDTALTTAPLTNAAGQTVGFVGVQRDITRQKELDRMKDQFVSNVSHELRTPLANILLHVGLLEHGKPDRLASYRQTLQREAERLRKLIEDLLDLSRLDRNVASIQLARIDLNQLLEHLVTDRSALAEQRGLTLTYEPTTDLPLVLTDASQLIQVASNLMTNALNYTPAGGAVNVWAEVRRHAEQNMVAFTVRDTGPGISTQDVPHLFERFYRGTSGRQASAPGTGLGLAISQEIMKRLHGRITVESEVGRGAAFTVWLPIA